MLTTLLAQRGGARSLKAACSSDLAEHVSYLLEAYPTWQEVTHLNGLYNHHQSMGVFMCALVELRRL